MLNSTASAQSSSPHGRWTLLPGGFAKVPVKDLRYAAAHRLVANHWRSNAVLEIASLRKAIDTKDQQIAKMLERDSLQAVFVRHLVVRTTVLEDELEKAKKKQANLKPWANLGKAITATAVIVTGILLIKPQLQ